MSYIIQKIEKETTVRREELTRNKLKELWNKVLNKEQLLCYKGNIQPNCFNYMLPFHKTIS